MAFAPLTSHLFQRSGLIRGGIALTALLLTVVAQWLMPAQRAFLADEWLRDRFLALQVSSAEEPRILVVDIDEPSMAELGPWPWPRERLATLVETLVAEYGAKGVALDIVLPEAQATGSGDARLAVLAEHGPVVVPHVFNYQNTSETPIRDGTLAPGRPDSGAWPAVPAYGYIANHAGLAVAAHVANIGFIPDRDGVLRRLPLFTSYNGRVYPALSLALIECCAGGPAPALRKEAFTRVPYTRDWSAFTVVSAADIVKQRIAPRSASGRLVLVGSSAMGQADRVATPLAAQRPGLAVHATMLSHLLDQQAGRAPTPLPGRAIAFLFALGLVGVALYAFPRVSALEGVGLIGGGMLAWLGIAWALVPHDPDFATTGPLATGLFLLTVAVPFQWHLTQQRSRNLLDTLRQYVAREVVDELLRSDLQDPLTPAQRDVTTLIADMEGYTSHVESLPMAEAAQLTRDFLDCLTGPVLDHQGTLDKYTGDGLVAFWGAPLPNAAHADLALDAACEITRRVQQLSTARVAAGLPPLRVRIGIESGPAMAGDFGTAFRSIYTAVGDSVNTASRLEQAARDFPHDVIIGAGTVARAQRHRFLLLGERLLRGKERPTTLFTFYKNSSTADSRMPFAQSDTRATLEPAR